jgi:hypothetical protein
MADDTTTDAPPIPDSVQEALDLAKAASTHDEATQLDATLAPKVADGTLNEADVYHAQADAVAAHDAWEHAKSLQHEEAIAASAGDVAHAIDLGINAGYDLQLAEDKGGAAAHPTIDALEDKQDHSVHELVHAQWEGATAHEYAADASGNAASGNYDNAAASGDTAAAHHDASMDHIADAGHSDTSSVAAAEPAAASETSGETTV